MNFIIIFIVVLLVIVLLVGRQLAYNDILPKKSPSKSNALDNYEFKNIEFLNNESKTLRGWFIKSKSNPLNRTLFVLHGWTRTRLKYIEQIKFFVDSGFHVFTYDQISHGDSDKGAVTFGDMEGQDLLLAVEYSKSISDIDQEKIAVVGFSLGTAAAIFASSNSKTPVFKALILEGAFASSYDVGEKLLVSTFGKIIGKFIEYFFFTFGTQIWSLGKFKHANTANEISKIKNIPIMIIRGKNDPLVPEESAQKLINATNEPLEVWIHEEGRHTMSFETYPEEYKQRVISFLNRYL